MQQLLSLIEDKGADARVNIVVELAWPVFQRMLNEKGVDAAIAWLDDDGSTFGTRHLRFVDEAADRKRARVKLRQRAAEAGFVLPKALRKRYISRPSGHSTLH